MPLNFEALARLNALNSALLLMLQNAITLDDKIRLYSTMTATSREISRLVAIDIAALTNMYTPGQDIKASFGDLKQLQSEVHVIISDIVTAAAVLSAIGQAVSFLAPLL